LTTTIITRAATTLTPSIMISTSRWPATRADYLNLGSCSYECSRGLAHLSRAIGGASDQCGPVEQAPKYN
jgi:hypothetical protein